MKTLFLFLFTISTEFIFPQMNTGTPDTLTKEIIKSDLSIWDVFQERRSVRKYKPDPVPQEDLVKIIDAARMAPTSGNQQPWKFLVIQDQNKIAEMKNLCLAGFIENYDNNPDKSEDRESFINRATESLTNYFSAPVYIVILTDNNSMYPTYNHWDGPLAAGYLMLAARSLGYGTVFITDAIPDNVTKTALGIPDNYTRVCITPLGTPVEWPKSPKKKELEEFIIYEKF
ncbi:MAG: nitroreductase family protein [Ignavibacteriaceae bacterium]